MQLKQPRFKDALGRYGEAIAARCLTDSGHRLIEVNWRCARGEIDIIAADGPTLVICETPRMNSGAQAGCSTRQVRVRSRGPSTPKILVWSQSSPVRMQCPRPPTSLFARFKTAPPCLSPATRRRL